MRVGNIEWTLQPGYPQLSGEANAEQIIMKFITAESSLQNGSDSALPAYGTSFGDFDFKLSGRQNTILSSVFSGFGSLRLTSRSILPVPSSDLYELTLYYTSAELDKDQGDTEVDYVNRELAVPIESLEKYRTKWKYDLCRKKGVSMSPSFWDSAKDTVLSSDNFVWVRNGDQTPDGYEKIYSATKPGVETKMCFVPEVHMRKYSLAKKYLAKIAARDGTRQSPPDDFGYSGEWIQSGSSIRREGRYYVLDTSFLASKTWDHDIYD